MEVLTLCDWALPPVLLSERFLQLPSVGLVMKPPGTFQNHRIFENGLSPYGLFI